jgi:hypothetical protein
MRIVAFFLKMFRLADVRQAFLSASRSNLVEAEPACRSHIAELLRLQAGNAVLFRTGRAAWPMRTKEETAILTFSMR